MHNDGQKDNQPTNEASNRVDEVKRRATVWKQTTEQHVEEMRRLAWQQASDAQGAYGETRVRSKEAARQMWERSEPLRQGARDVGEGLTRAWSELRASLGKAARRIQTESAPPSSSSSDKGST